MNIGTNVTGITIPEGAAKNIKRGTEMLWQDGGLPTAFQRCEYIEVASLNAYIKTNFYTAGKWRFDIDFSLPNNTNGTVFGQEFVYGSRLLFRYNDSDIPLILRTNNYDDLRGVFPAAGSRYIAGIESTGSQIKYYKDGTLVKTVNVSQGSQSNNPCCIFCNEAYSQTAPVGSRFYSLACKNEGELSGNYVPCYLRTAWNGIPAGTIGLYDLCGSLSSNGTPFYTNAGTGAFTKGADVV